MNPSPLTTQHQINCFTLERPLFCSSSCSGLLIADTAHHIYKFNFKQTSHKQGLDNSLQIDDPDLSHEDLGSMLGLNINTHSSLDLSFHMDVQMEVVSCHFEIIPVDSFKVEVLAVLGRQANFKIWVKLPHQTQYSLLPIQSLQNIENIVDFGFEHTSLKNQTSLIILSNEKEKSMLKVHKLQLTEQSMKEFNPPIQINLQTSSGSCARLVDRCRVVAIENRLLGVYQKYEIVFDGIKQLSRSIQCGNRYVLYGDGDSAWVYDRKQEISKCALKDQSVISLKFVEVDGVFVCLISNPTLLHVYSNAAHLLWAIDMQYIESPLTVFQNSGLFQLQILDRQNIRLHQLSKSCLLSSAPQLSCPIEQQKVHISTTTTLKHRVQILRTLESYANNEDYSSLMRYLQNCNNNTILNDGLMLIHHRVAKLMNSTAKEERVVLTLSSMLLQQSKYESHLENSLETLLESCKRLKIQGKQDPRLWQECMKIIKELVGGKKIRKLQQQEKNKRIFELAYQLVHTANSHLLQYT